MGRHGPRAGRFQIPRPEVTSEFDVSEPLAAENRFEIFDYVAKEGHLVTGGHLHLPGSAHLVPNGRGFQLMPEPWMVEI